MTNEEAAEFGAERKAFEEWADKLWPGAIPSQLMWRGWKARAALAQQPDGAAPSLTDALKVCMGVLDRMGNCKPEVAYAQAALAGAQAAQPAAKPVVESKPVPVPYVLLEQWCKTMGDAGSNAKRGSSLERRCFEAVAEIDALMAA
jgi:hypothetical protein